MAAKWKALFGGGGSVIYQTFCWRTQRNDSECLQVGKRPEQRVYLGLSKALHCLRKFWLKLSALKFRTKILSSFNCFCATFFGNVRKACRKCTYRTLSIWTDQTIPRQMQQPQDSDRFATNLKRICSEIATKSEFRSSDRKCI